VPPDLLLVDQTEIPEQPRQLLQQDTHLPQLLQVDTELVNPATETVAVAGGQVVVPVAGVAQRELEQLVKVLMAAQPA
jgi:hypothetical protein